MMSKSYFLYKTVAPSTGCYYIGVHSTRRPYTDGYQGSGDWIKHCLENKVHLVTGILEFFPSAEEAYAKEANLVTWERIRTDPLMMNRICGGMGGWKGMTAERCAERNRRDQSEEEKRKRSETLTAFYKNNVHHTTGKPKDAKQKHQMSLSQRGRTFSDDSRTRMSISQKKRYEMLEVKPVPPNNKGATYNMKLMECPKCGFRGKGGNMTRYHFEKCRY
jgi:hypothetical protein